MSDSRSYDPFMKVVLEGDYIESLALFRRDDGSLLAATSGISNSDLERLRGGVSMFRAQQELGSSLSFGDVERLLLSHDTGVQIVTTFDHSPHICCSLLAIRHPATIGMIGLLLAEAGRSLPEK